MARDPIFVGLNLLVACLAGVMVGVGRGGLTGAAYGAAAGMGAAVLLFLVAAAVQVGRRVLCLLLRRRG